eukprot:scaffold28477_cov21-Tisochrysis_lutea.AAC.1
MGGSCSSFQALLLSRVAHSPCLAPPDYAHVHHGNCERECMLDAFAFCSFKSFTLFVYLRARAGLGGCSLGPAIQ